MELDDSLPEAHNSTTAELRYQALVKQVGLTPAP
jgi:hypothetical protein